jgi:hypothetical protein
MILISEYRNLKVGDTVIRDFEQIGKLEIFKVVAIRENEKVLQSFDGKRIAYINETNLRRFYIKG